eukprot:c20912_g1_i1.p1 GENE.c20912_g1_i1~~c20912_g1_i1.p1  ORF type:complete len:833 (-),score=162.98 c20912_g1_i1:72-2468(-)
MIPSIAPPLTNISTPTESNTMSSTLSPSSSATISPSSTGSLSQTLTATASPSPSLSAPPALVDSPLFVSALRVRASMDNNPAHELIDTNVTVEMVGDPFKPISAVRLYATGADGIRGGLLETIEISEDQRPVKVVLQNLQSFGGSGAGLLAIGVEAIGGLESTVDYDHVPLVDWTRPRVDVLSIVQGTDSNTLHSAISALVKVTLRVRFDADAGPLVGIRLYLVQSTNSTQDNNNNLNNNEERVQRQRIALTAVLMAADLAADAVDPSTLSGSFDLGNVALPGIASEELAKRWLQWEVVGFNQAFESEERGYVDVEDSTGLADAVSAVLASVSVTAVATTVAASLSTSVSSAAAAGVNVVTVGSGVNASSATVASPTIMIGNLQSAAMTGSMQVTMPSNYRSFATKLSWTNGNIKLTHPISSQVASDEVDLSSKFRFGASLKSVGASRVESIATGGSSAHTALQDTLLSFVFVFLCCLTVSVAWSSYCATRQVLDMRKVRTVDKALKQAFIGVFTASYYGLTVTALIALWTHSVSEVDKIVATLVLLAIGLPFPFLSVALYRGLVPSADDSNQDTQSLLQMVSPTRRGCEWYGVLSTYRRLVSAIAIGLLPNTPETQCIVIMAVFAACFLANVWYKPFRGGWKSVDFALECLSQVMVTLSCSISLYLHHSSPSPSLVVSLGALLVVGQLVGIVIMTLLGITSLIRLFLGAFFGPNKTPTEAPNHQFAGYESPRLRKRSSKQRASRVCQAVPLDSDQNLSNSVHVSMRLESAANALVLHAQPGSVNQVKAWLSNTMPEF